MQNKIAIIFDFDGTLAPDTTSGFLEEAGIDAFNFWKEEVAPLVEDNWDNSTSYLYKIIELSNSGRIDPITKERLVDWGSRALLYPGADGFFDRLRAFANKLNPDIRVEFYSISGGIIEILGNTKISHQFEEIWACEFIYDEEGKILFPKKIVSSADKTRYLYHVSKGIFGSNARGKPFEVHRRVEKHNLRVPFSQIIMVGDGYTDIPCFSVVNNEGGTSIGVYDENERFYPEWGSIEPDMVSSLVPADYSEGSKLDSVLMAAINRIAANIETKSMVGV